MRLQLRSCTYIFCYSVVQLCCSCPHFEGAVFIHSFCGHIFSEKLACWYKWVLVEQKVVWKLKWDVDVGVFFAELFLLLRKECHRVWNVV